MAAARRNRSDVALCALLLAVGWTRHYGWDLFPEGFRALASKGLGGVAILALLGVVCWLAHARVLWPVLLWWTWEELQVVLCSFWFMFDPWPSKPEEPMCSAKVGFDIGAFGILIVAVLAYRLVNPTTSSRSQKEKEQSK